MGNNELVNQDKELKVDAKVKLIVDEIIKGVPSRVFVPKFAEQWNVSERAVRLVLTDAYTYLREYAKQDLDNIRNTNFERLLEIYKEATQDKNKAVAMKAIDMLNKMAGVYVDKKEVDLTVKEFEFKF